MGKEKRKEMKHKKNKKDKKRKLQKSASSTSSGSESDEWVEQKKEATATSKQKEQGLSRDDWMSMTGIIATYSKDDIRPPKKEKEKKHTDTYNPSTSVRELNPYWKDGGVGLPTTSEEIRASKPFKQPDNDDDLYKSDRSKFKRPDNYYNSKTSRKPDDYESFSHERHYKSVRSDRSRELKKTDNRGNYYGKSEWSRMSIFKKPSNDDNYYNVSEKRSRKNDDYRSSSSSNWKKHREDDSKTTIENTESPPKPNMEEPMIMDNEIKETKPPHDKDKYLSDEKMNKLASKIVKAEIMGDMDLLNKLKTKLEEARLYRKENPDAGKTLEQPEDIMLMSTNSRGDYRPLTKSSQAGDLRSKGGKKKTETHNAGERMKFFSDDDGRSLSEMYEQEKYGSNWNEEAQLANVVAKHTNPNDDLEDIFTEEISKTINRAKEDETNKQRAIKEHTKLEKSLEGCEYCFGSKAMMKHLIVSCGSKVYLAVPAKKSLTNGHCIITTVQHATSITAVDEDVWEEIVNFRKALVNYFNSRDEDVVFFETAVRLYKYPHLVINCVPMPRDVGDTAPIYFKKALLECEAEWSMNKKVVDLKGRSVRKGVPKGLPYFWVDFGMDPGFAHVIEDQQLFPNNFAEEIIGGILDLDHSLWKRPQREQGDQLRAKVSEFVQTWKKFDTVSLTKI